MFADDPEYHKPVRQYAVQSYRPHSYLSPRYRAPQPIFTTGSIDPIRQQNQIGNQAFTVNYGDTLFSIFRRTGVNPGQLAKINHLPYPYMLHQGQVLQLR